MRLRFYVFSEEPRNVWLARLGALVMPGRVVAPEMAGGAGGRWRESGCHDGRTEVGLCGGGRLSKMLKVATSGYHFWPFGSISSTHIGLKWLKLRTQLSD
jgi:hypothetical protein